MVAERARDVPKSHQMRDSQKANEVLDLVGKAEDEMKKMSKKDLGICFKALCSLSSLTGRIVTRSINLGHEVGKMQPTGREWHGVLQRGTFEGGRTSPH